MGRRTRYTPRTLTCMQTVPFAGKVIKANQKETFVHTYATVKSDVQYVTATSPRACLKLRCFNFDFKDFYFGNS